jgi:acyl-CoA synthetase (AMP-forming)/AMP-acid ligase II
LSEILARFEKSCRDDPARRLIHVPAMETSHSASDVWSAHLRGAAHLTRLGLDAGQLVVSAAGNHPAGIPFFLACRANGVAIMPVDSGTSVAEILRLAEHFGAAALLLPASMPADRARFGDRPLIDVDGLQLVRSSERDPRTYRGTALLKLTSGSTGAPKAALATDAQMVSDGVQIAAAMGITPADTQMAIIPLSHSYGLGVVLMPMLLQGTAIVLRDSFVPPYLPADARQFGVRVLAGAPFMFQYFVTNPPAGDWPSELRWLVSAGAPLPAATVGAFHERFAVKIHSFYGTTETGGIAFDDDDDIRAEPVVGRALPGVIITLRPDEHAPAGAGRVHVRSGAVAAGYSDQTRGGFGAGGDDGFLTDDYGTRDAEQRLTLRGRVSAFVNVAGRKVHPEEVEQVLRMMPGVADVRILSAPDARRGQQVVACIVAEPGTVSALSVRQFCASRLAAHKIPRTVVVLAEMPLTERGKTDRAALEDLVRAQLRQDARPGEI